MATATKTTTTERNPQEGASATSITELGEKEALSTAEENVERLVVSRGNHRISGRIAHPLTAVYDWLSGPPMRPADSASGAGWPTPSIPGRPLAS